MLRFAVCLFAAVLGGGSLAAADPLADPLPPVRGDISGQLVLPKLPGLPALAWQVELQPAKGGNLALSARARATGLELAVELVPPRGESPGTWRIVEAKLDAASWWRLVTQKTGTKTIPDDFEFTGRLTLSGAGEWRGAEVSGSLHVELAEGTAGSAAQHWTATGLALEADLAFLQSKTALRSARVRVDTIQVLGLAATGLALEAVGLEGDQISVTRAEVAVLGDQVKLTPFTINPADPVLKTTVDFSQLALGDLAILAPQAVKEAKGRVAGRITVEWRPKAGSVAAEGKLASLTGESSMLRLAPSPGLLTSRVPARLGFAFISLKNPAVDTLRRLELGEDALNVDSLQMDIYPPQPEGGRSAQIRVVGRPFDDRDVKHITFTVNLAGPLDQVLRFGLTKKGSIQMGTGK